MKSQANSNITDKMRAIVIDWLIEVHSQFKLLPETLFLAVNILDRYLEKVKADKDQLQLIAVSALIISCKYQEILFPESRDIEFVTEGTCKKAEVIQMQNEILSVLNFSVTVVTPNTLLWIFLEKLKISYDSVACGMSLPPHWDILVNLAGYIAELQLTEYKMLKYAPSAIAAGSLYLAWKILKTVEPKRGVLDWPETMNKIVCHSEHEIHECAKDLFVLLKNSEKSSLQAIRRKYMMEERGKVALMKVPEGSSTTHKKRGPKKEGAKEKVECAKGRICTYKEAR